MIQKQGLQAYSFMVNDLMPMIRLGGGIGAFVSQDQLGAFMSLSPVRWAVFPLDLDSALRNVSFGSKSPCSEERLSLLLCARASEPALALT